MPEKVKKPAKPTTNLLQNIRSPRPSQIDENVPKSKHYRSELEPLLGAAITLKCPDWTIFHEEHYTKILLKGALCDESSIRQMRVSANCRGPCLGCC